MRSKIALLLLAASVLLPAITSTAAPSYAETRVWGFELQTPPGAWAERGSSETGIEGYRLAYDEKAVGYPLVPRGGVAPSEIRFSQPTISQNFSSKGTINDLVAGLRSGRIRIEDVPPIRVVERSGQLFTLDNRRLASFQAAGVERIPVQRVSLSDPAIAREFAKKFNPIDDGRFIVVTPNAAGRNAAESLLRQQGKVD